MAKLALAFVSALGLSEAAQFRGTAAGWKGPSKEQIESFAQTLFSEPKQKQDKPSISAYVMSRVDGVERRGLIREMWQRASASEDMYVNYSFAVCANAPEKAGGHDATAADSGVTLQDASPELKAQLDKEKADFNDVLYLDCAEGYGEGALTKKTLAALKHFNANQNSDFFMKLDDDTFIAWQRYKPHLLQVGHPYMYMGILIGEGVPCRIESFRWYEPFETFSDDLFPAGMSGGSGYTIGHKLVDIIVKTGLADSNILYNEDRAVGFWMDSIKKTGTHVDYANVKGVDGFWAWDWRNPGSEWASWGAYPHFLHHGLEGQTIACLSNLDNENDASKPVKDCFSSEEGKQYTPLRCAQLNTAGQEKQKAQRLALLSK